MDDFTIPSAAATAKLLDDRLGADAVRSRLEAEKGHGKPVAGHATVFAYLEEWFLGPKFLRAVLGGLGLYRRGRKNALDITLRRNEFIAADLPAAFDGFRILHLSDLHIDVSRQLQSVLHERMEGLEFDLGVITGDLRFATYGDARPALAAMQRLRPLLGSRALLVLGNHDSLRWVPVLEDFGYEVLVNEFTQVSVNGDILYIGGVDDAGYFGASDLAAAGAAIPDQACALLLSHSPEIVADSRLEKFDFVLCGHSHGGQINLPGGWPLVTNTRCHRRYCKGRWRHGPVQGYTSSGVGTSLLDVRFNCPPEITLHRLLVGHEPA